jgi:hypothetical protein
MLIVRTPTSHEVERRYVFAVVLGEWLGLTWRHLPEARADVSISIDGEAGELLLPDPFFGMTNHHWLRIDSLPQPMLAELKTDCLDAGSASATPRLPILFGSNAQEIEWTRDILRLPIDIFGSIFFMLSAYDELVLTDRDEHGRFPGRVSTANRCGYIDRPLADEYSELLWNALHTLWPQLVRRRLLPSVILSCDVDEPFDSTVSGLGAFLRATAGDILKRGSTTEAWLRGVRFINNRLGNYSYDRCYTFDNYFQICSEFDLQATFFFIPSSAEPNNGCYSLFEPRIQQLLRKIEDAGHKLGMHGCYEAYRDANKTICHRELMISALANAGIKQSLDGNRQHYLRWDSAITPAILDQAGFKYDTSGGFADCAGFRFGTAREFSMWDWSRSAQLKLCQRPLVVMDCTITDYMGLGRGREASAKIRQLRKQALKFGGNFTVLWHNSCLNSHEDYLLLRSALSDETQIDVIQD